MRGSAGAQRREERVCGPSAGAPLPAPCAPSPRPLRTARVDHIAKPRSISFVGVNTRRVLYEPGPCGPLWPGASAGWFACASSLHTAATYMHSRPTRKQCGCCCACARGMQRTPFARRRRDILMQPASPALVQSAGLEDGSGAAGRGAVMSSPPGHGTVENPPMSAFRAVLCTICWPRACCYYAPRPPVRPRAGCVCTPPNWQQHAPSARLAGASVCFQQ